MSNLHYVDFITFSLRL